MLVGPDQPGTREAGQAPDRRRFHGGDRQEWARTRRAGTRRATTQHSGPGAYRGLPRTAGPACSNATVFVERGTYPRTIPTSVLKITALSGALQDRSAVRISL